VTRRVLGVVLPFAILEVGWLHEDPCAVLPGPLAVGARVLHAYGHRVGHLAGTRGAAIASHISDNHGAIAEPELCPVALADPHPLLEPEGRTQPGDRLADIGIDQDGDDRRRRDGAVGLHGRTLLHLAQASIHPPQYGLAAAAVSSASAAGHVVKLGMNAKYPG